MEPKKISFGFSKINKKLNFIVNKESQKSDNKVELIKCLEGQEIKLVEEKQEEAPLIIPLKENQKTSTALASLIKRRAVLLGEDELELIPQENNGVVSDIANNELEDIEKRAAKELLAELNANGSLKSETNLILPVVHPDDLPLEGAKESSMDDYESIPVQDFGKAMLRGMGWVEPLKATKGGGPPLDEMPSVRPKGMGLGADKALKAKPLLVAPESNEVLEIKRNAYVRILGGKHTDLYGQIEGFDDHAGRVIVKMAIGGIKEAFNEFLCQPISRKEYAQYGKCINTAKYEEYKSKENEHGQIILKKEEIEKIDQKSEKYQKMKIQKEERDRGPAKYKKEVEEISSEDDNRKPKQEFQDEKSTDGYEKWGDNYRHRRDDARSGATGSTRDDHREEERDNSQRDYRDKEKQYTNETKREHEDRKKDNYKDYNIYERERNRDYTNEKTRNRDDNKDGERPRDRHGSKYDHDSSTSKRDSNRDYVKDNRRNDDARERNKDYEERSSRPRKASTSDETSEYDERSKPKKSSKEKKSKKKSKKNKKSKSKYDSNDSESSSSAPEEERRKRHKKKTKKSKKQRERSRSRGRR